MSLGLFLSSAWDDGTQRVNTRFGWHGQRIGRGSYRESRGRIETKRVPRSAPLAISPADTSLEP